MKRSKRNFDNEQKRRKKTEAYLKQKQADEKKSKDKKKNVPTSKYAKKKTKRNRGINNVESPFTPIKQKED